MITAALPTRGYEPPPDSLDRQKSTLTKIRERLRIAAVLDIGVIVVVTILICLLEFGFIPNIDLGYFCADPKYSYPYNGDTVSVATLLISAYVGPVVVIFAIEALKENSFKKVCIGTVWTLYKECLIGTTFVLLITEVIKVVVGSPRPHFITSCMPPECKSGTFIPAYTCTNNGLSNFFKADMVRSFPSGHTSISVFVALYLSYLVQIRIPSEVATTLTRPCLIAVCLIWSLLCSLTRITDRRHHWWDVLGGAFLGVCGAWYFVLLSKKEKRLSRSDTSTTTTTLSDIRSKDNQVV